ncbi:hypothetical protein NEOLEDRAFT_1181525 [Neolentinus lepideus HHB14362 ss-1]|uniref:Chromo domain-containing protein n=1 Tax=Neolentinus lepideus HHB14362 ss-1 TaxID=1314782 RepID=A0A165PZ24_9AGAM|nr:hypothetical protein NEOLEDRAFT_1181525 [Neolentinus lepideus HHB14362 ss-1]
MPRKSKKQSEQEWSVEEGDDSDKSEELYTVEVVTQARVQEEDGDAYWEYRVKWAGYDSDQDTWEPEDNLQGCERLLRSFWDHIGTDDEDYPIGYTVRARSDWIDQEKKFFARTEKQQKEEAKEREKKKRRKEKQREKGGDDQKDTEKEKKSDKVSDTKKGKKDTEKSPVKSKEKRKSPKSCSSVISLSSTPPPKKDKGKGKAVHIEVVPEDDTFSEDDAPLSNLRRGHSNVLKRRLISPGDSESPPANDPSSKRAADKPDFKRPRISIDTSVQAGSAVSPKITAAVPNRSPSPVSDHDSLFSKESSPELPLASPPKPAPVVPAHRAPPKVKMMSLPSNAVAGGSALSTKQRILSGGIASPTIPGPRPPVARKESSLAKLAFKKNVAQDSRSTGTRADSGTPITPAAAASPSSMTSQPNWFASSPVLDSMEIVQSPVSVDHELPPPTRELFSTSSEPGPSRALSIPAAANQHAEADRFLATIMPPALAAPIDDDRPMTSPSIAQAPAVLKPAAFGRQVALPSALISMTNLAMHYHYRIPKKWKWTGDLFLQSDVDKAERFCQVALTDTTDHLQDGLRFSICFASVDSLRLKKLLDVADLDTLLSSCTRPQQMAKLAPQGQADTKPLETLTNFMLKRKKISYAVLAANNVTLGVLLVFPSGMSKLTDMFKVPLDLRINNSLTAVLLPWRLTSEKYKKVGWQGEGKLPVNDGRPDSGRAIVTAAKIPALVLQAIHLLNFPQWLYDHMVMRDSKRPYCIWNTYDRMSTKLCVETSALQVILKHCGASDVGLKADVRVVFIHVGSLDTIHKLPAFVERRCRRPEIQFVTYGTYENVPIGRWGVREIFPVGGVVTFTPSSLADTPLKTLELISRIDEHPLWLCYVTPAVVAAVFRQVYKDQREDAQLEREKDPLYKQVLQLIEDGHKSLIHAPPTIRGTAQNANQDWISLQTILMRLSRRGLLEECAKIFQSEFANVLETNLAAAMIQHVSRGLAWIQSQPVFMDDFRRFVVITGPQDKNISWDRDGFEWLPASEFRFKDDWFKDDSRK